MTTEQEGIRKGGSVPRLGRGSAGWACAAVAFALLTLLPACSGGTIEDTTETTTSTSGLTLSLPTATSSATPAPAPTGSSACKPRKPRTQAECEEPQPPPVPPDGKCNIEIMAEWVEYLGGQGFLEGDAEGSVSYTLTDAKTGSVTTTRLPSSGTYDLVKDERYLLNRKLGTYTVKKGQFDQVEVCASFVEHDSGLNGKNDTGRDCQTLTLSCPEPSNSELLYAQLCQGGDCNTLVGAMDSSVKVLAADADGDCVDNENDYTPEPCDEIQKGQLCRASLVYFYYGDGPMTNLVQNLGTDLSKAMTGYDRVFLLIDHDEIGPFNLNPAALAVADVVMPPTEQNFFAALQELTSEGCDMDVWAFSHGEPEWEAEADLSVISVGGSIKALADDDHDKDPPDITSSELLDDTAPENSGTPSVPVRMTYGTPCFYQAWNEAWSIVGAKVTSGAIDVNFVPNFYESFADGWNAGRNYGAALAGEYSAASEELAFGYVELEGAGPPWLCLGTGNTVLDTNACALNFFTDTDLMAEVDSTSHFVDGADEAKYGLGGPLWDTVGIVYDPTVSGANNMAAASAKAVRGDTTIRKNMPATLRWP
jgi:hypothetical protein